MDTDISEDVDVIRSIKRREGIGLDKETLLITESLYKNDTNEIQYKSTSKGWIDTLNPYYRAFNGDIPLTPDVFEILSIPSSYEVFSQEDLGVLQNIDYCSDFGWRIEDLKDEILKHEKDVNLSLLTGDPDDVNKQIYGMRKYPNISISSDLNVNYNYQNTSKIIYEGLYRTLYNTLNTPINWDKVISFKMLLPKEYELISDRVTGNPDKFSLYFLYNNTDVVDKILDDTNLGDYGKLGNLMIVGSILRCFNYLSDFDIHIIDLDSVRLLLGTNLNDVNVAVDEKNLGEILLLSTLLEKDINNKRRIYDYVLLNYGIGVLDFNDGIKSKYKEFISPSVIVASLGNINNSSKGGFKYTRRK